MDNKTEATYKLMTTESGPNLSQSLSGGWETVTKSEEEGMMAEINRNQPPFVARATSSGGMTIRQSAAWVKLEFTAAASVWRLASIQANDTTEIVVWNVSFTEILAVCDLKIHAEMFIT
jgi:hypothetical protein